MTDERRERLAGLREALAPFARFAEQWDRQPLRGVDDNFYFYKIHVGTEYEAGLSLTDCRRAAAVLALWPKETSE